MQITDAQYEEYCERGYVVLRAFLPEEKRQQCAAALRRALKPWDEVRDNPPRDRTAMATFPYAEPVLNELILLPPVLEFARRVLRTPDIVYRAGVSLVRYPGFLGEGQGVHIDNGNNSLLPKSESDPTYGQMTCWWHLEDVGEDQAPLHFIPIAHGRDTTKYEKLVVPGGTLCIFNTYIWHSASDYHRADGQRYSLGYMYGRTDHHWEGFRHYTNLGYHADFQRFIGSLTPSQRELFHFPPVGHPYYTPQTLAALEQQYPGWRAADYL